MKKALIILFCILVNSISFAYDFSAQGFYCEIITPTTVKLVGHTSKTYKSKTSFTLPTTVKDENNNNYTVTALGERLFQYCAIKTIVLPENLESIENSCFEDCVNLTDVIIPNSVIEIGDGAFASCSKLKIVSIPKSVRVLGNSVFAHCSSLTYCNFQNPEVKSGDYMFRDCIALTNIQIPASYTRILEGWFKGCTGITELNLPNNITVIEKMAFKESGVKIADLSGVKFIERESFFSCENLESVTLTSTLMSLPENCFENCTNLKTIAIPNSVQSIRARCFYNCEKLETVAINPNAHLKEIHYEAFYGCRSLKEITLPENLKFIGIWGGIDNTFWNCNSLEKINCYVFDPITISDNDFYNYNATLYVYNAVEDIYKTTKIWKNFNIQGFDCQKTVIVSIEEWSISNMGKELNSVEYNCEVGDLLELNANNIIPKGYNFFSWGGKHSSDTTISLSVKNNNHRYILWVIPKQTLINEIEMSNQIVISNNQILVNGEAPAFVVTISGQKIANQNLRAGVYFVNVEGEIVKVVK